MQHLDNRKTARYNPHQRSRRSSEWFSVGCITSGRRTSGTLRGRRDRIQRRRANKAPSSSSRSNGLESPAQHPRQQFRKLSLLLPEPAADDGQRLRRRSATGRRQVGHYPAADSRRFGPHSEAYTEVRLRDRTEIQFPDANSTGSQDLTRRAKNPPSKLRIGIIDRIATEDVAGCRSRSSTSPLTITA